LSLLALFISAIFINGPVEFPAYGKRIRDLLLSMFTFDDVFCSLPLDSVIDWSRKFDDDGNFQLSKRVLNRRKSHISVRFVSGDEILFYAAVSLTRFKWK
jgi:hypothetical protein